MTYIQFLHHIYATNRYAGSIFYRCYVVIISIILLRNRLNYYLLSIELPWIVIRRTSVDSFE